MGEWGADEWGLALAVVLAPLAFIGLWYSVRAHRTSEIAVYVQKSAKIVADITADVSGLEVSYRGSRELKNLVRLTGFIRNDGNLDIDRRDVYSPLVLSLPSGGRWLEVNCFAERISAAAELDGQHVKFDWDMLEQSRKIRFEALLELPVGFSEARFLTADARIKNTKVKLDPGVYDQPRAVFILASIWPFALIFLCAGILSLSSIREITYVAAFDLEGNKLGPAILDRNDRICVSRLDWLSFDGHTCEYVPITVVSEKYSLRTLTEPYASKDPTRLGFVVMFVIVLLRIAIDAYSQVRTSKKRFDKVRWFSWRD